MIAQIAEPNVAPLDFDELFGRRAPVQVDLGCGDGSFLVSLAEQMPEKNFFGVERLLHRVRTAIRRSKRLNNVRVLRTETSLVVRHLLGGESVEGFYLLFPDPWPKRRHHRRRIVTLEFLSALSAALQPNGFLTIATDYTEYFDVISRLAQQSECFRVADRTWDGAIPETTFEKRFRGAGVPIHRLELRKVSPVR